jgi:hypothetical protein
MLIEPTGALVLVSRQNRGCAKHCRPPQAGEDAGADLDRALRRLVPRLGGRPVLRRAAPAGPSPAHPGVLSGPERVPRAPARVARHRPGWARCPVEGRRAVPVRPVDARERGLASPERTPPRASPRACSGLLFDCYSHTQDMAPDGLRYRAGRTVRFLSPDFFRILFPSLRGFVDFLRY